MIAGIQEGIITMKQTLMIMIVILTTATTVSMKEGVAEECEVIVAV